MCGIFISCSSSHHRDPSDEILTRLASRGPDSLGSVLRMIDSKVGAYQHSWYLKAISSVLSLRSTAISNQPIIDRSGQSESFLSWNGEAWKFDGNQLDTNDAEFIYHRLMIATSFHNAQMQRASGSSNRVSEAVVTAMSKTSGPYAFVFYDGHSRVLYYGRDILGRRSLLIRWPSPTSIEISSVGGDRAQGNWEEVNAGGIYVLDLAARATSDQIIEPSSESDKVPSPIFLPYQTQDDSNSLSSSLQSSFPHFNNDLVFIPPAINMTSPVLQSLHRLLQKSLALRLAFTSANGPGGFQDGHVAILFSGGVDCTLIARIANDVLSEDQEIHLLNVAFENPRVAEAAARNNSTSYSSRSAYELCPDRITGRMSHQELVHLCPRRIWRFISIDIPYHETKAHAPEVMALLHPHKTEMDLSIGYALYFAARGRGEINRPDLTTQVQYTTPARVLISGLGADELFGGYVRHATAFARRGYAGLAEELAMDFGRLSKRNLGRDDRLMSHWGKEVRYPFLDEELVIWALKLPPWEKCSFGEEVNGSSDIEPGKSIIRHLAWQLGLRGAAIQKKRAIQFGARTAKMESGRRKGTHMLE